MPDQDVFNSQLVAIRGEEILILVPKTVMTKTEALIHAAWLVALADTLDDKFPDILKTVRNT